MFKCLIGIGILMISATASAGCDSIGCRGKGAEAVTQIYIGTSGDILLGAPPSGSNLNCSLQGDAYMTLRSNHVRFNEIYAGILSALATNKDFYIRISDGSTGCNVSYVRIFS